jgi:hypothetical protein
MGGQLRIIAILTTFTVSCGGTEGPRQVEQPTLETLEPAKESPQTSLGEAAAPGFFRPCQIVVAGSGLVELSCDDYKIVEFRRPKSGGSGDVDLDDLMKVLGARFGKLSETRRDAAIDSLAIRLSDFAATDSAGPQGMAASVSNSAGQYWAFVCYRRGGEISKGFCGDAIATAARAGGLAYVEAKALEDFGAGKLKVSASCQSTPGSKISCPGGELSWSPDDGRSAMTLREETLTRLTAMASEEKVSLKKQELACKLLGKSASCLYLNLISKNTKEALNFVLVTGGEQERLVICTFPDSEGRELPEPCEQAIEIKLSR